MNSAQQAILLRNNHEMATSQYELIVRLDEPFSGSSRCADRLELCGWVLAPGTAEHGQLPELTLVLEDLGMQKSILGAGMSQMGTEVSLEDTGDGAYLETFELSPVAGSFVDPSGIISGTQYALRGVLNVRRLRPGSGENPALICVALHARMAPRQSVSNKAFVSLLPVDAEHKACGGFLQPAVALEEIHSEFLIVQGWAVKSGAVVSGVAVAINDTSCGEARLHLPSPNQASMLPDATGVDSCAFSIILRRDDVQGAGVTPAAMKLPVILTVKVHFADGEILDLGWRSFRWYPDPLCEKRPADLVGCIEQVGESTGGLLYVSGWIIDGALSEPALRLEWARAVQSFSCAADSPPGLSWNRREDIALRYVTLASSLDCGFRLEFPVEILGRLPGAIQLSAVAGTSVLPLGPPAMCTVIEEECARLRAEGGAVSAIDWMLRTGGHLQRASSLRRAVAPSPTGTVAVNTSATRTNVPQRILFATPNLSQTEGAPKVLFHAIKHIQQQAPGVQVVVISAKEGALRAPLEGVGVRVEVCQALSMVDQSWERYLGGLREVQEVCATFKPELIYANVIDSFWAVDLARRLGLPSIWAIHESVLPEMCFFELEENLRLSFLHALAFADSAIFVAEQTKTLFSSVRRGNSRVIANGIDTAAIDTCRTRLSRVACRSALGVSENTFVVTILGTTTKRKGQDSFIREAALLRTRLPDVRFFIVGARESDFLTQLEVQAEKLGLADVLTFVGETADVAQYFIASDSMVIASREESAPLVSLEAFAFGVPLVSTTVFGLAAQIDPGRNALSFDSEQVGELSNALLELAQNPELRTRLVAGGRETVESRFALAPVMSQYWDELMKVLYSAA